MILKREIEKLEALGYKNLLRYLGTHEEREVLGSTGEKYLLCIEAWWDDQPQGNLRVAVSLRDKRRLHLFSNRQTDFLIAPDNSTDFPEATCWQKWLLRIAFWIFTTVLATGIVGLLIGLIR